MIIRPKRSLLRPSRRAFISGAASLLAAPAIVKAGWLPLASGAGGGFTPTTWNPSDKSLGTLDATNLIFTDTAPGGGNDAGVRAISGKSAGKYYFEVNYTDATATGNGDQCVGIAKSTPSFQTIATLVTDAAVLFVSGNLWIQGVNARSLATPAWTFPYNVTIGVAADLGAQNIWVTIDGTTWSGGSGTPVAGTGGNSFAGITAPYFPVVVGSQGSPDVFTANFGAGGAGAFTFAGAAAALVTAGWTAGWPA